MIISLRLFFIYLLRVIISFRLFFIYLSMVIISFRLFFIYLLMVIISFRLFFIYLLIVIISFEPGNTGKPVRMTHNNIILYGHPVRMIQNWPRILYGQYGPTGGRVGWLKHLRKNPFSESVSWKTEYCIYHWILTFWYFYKKDARRNFTHFGVPHAPRSLIWDPFRPEN